MGLSEVVDMCVGEVCGGSGLCGCFGVVGGGWVVGGWVLLGGWRLYRLGWLWVEEGGDGLLVRVEGVIFGDDI